jgi:AcrR family transcriptional regulator
MARPRSEEKREAIFAAATKVIAARGLGAPTALIAKEARVANGSVFTYFETKAALFNALYLELKTDMAAASAKDFPATADVRQQMHHVWSRWMTWATRNPDKRRALAQLSVAEEVDQAAGQAAMEPVAVLLEQCRAGGPLEDAPMAFVAALLDSLATTTMDFMLREPRRSNAHREAGFDAMWRMLR